MNKFSDNVYVFLGVLLVLGIIVLNVYGAIDVLPKAASGIISIVVFLVFFAIICGIVWFISELIHHNKNK